MGTAPSNASVNAAAIVSSSYLLHQLFEAFANSPFDNRFVAIANYGHGKSHLALALANYFSKPVASEEAQLLQGKLEHALNDPAKSSRFRDFKQARGEFLIVRLRGDTPSNLREQFIPSLERALQAHKATENIKPPLWHEYAEKVLTSLNIDEIDKANAQLATVRFDVPTLIEQIRQRKDVRDYCIQALTAAKNMAPDLGAQLSLRETVEWVADNVCGEDKPLAGMLVMFDEFSLYVSRYAQRGAVGELQDLLNGVSNRPTKVVFLAFAQHDPATIADNAPLSDHGRDTLKHELTRIPKKLALYTLMESVIDAYLRQREMAWLGFTEDKNVSLAIDQASHVAYGTFQSRYMYGLQWSPARFDKTVTKGSFPLHPLTTALLCNLKFSAAGGMSDPRTVLGFVMQHLNDKMDQLTIVNGAINWVRPVALVNYFGESISPEAYRLYQNARRNLGSDANDEQRCTLMALFLLEATQITLSKEAQIEFLVESTGLIGSSVMKALEALTDSNAIRYDSIKKTYSFWPTGADPRGLEELLRIKLEKISFDLTSLKKLNDKLNNLEGYGNIPMNLPWGHPEDWAATQVVLTKEYFDCDYISALVKPFVARQNGLEDGKRGLVIWLLACNEEDVRWGREHAEAMLDKALNGNAVAPVIAVMPKEPIFDLIAAFRRSLALNGLSQNERSKGGAGVFEYESEKNERTILTELAHLIGNKDSYLDISRDPSTIITPSVFRAAILSQPKLTIKNMLVTAYELAYRTAPREFFTQYRATTQGNNNLRNAVKQVAGILFTGKTEGLTSSISTNPVARDLCNRYLAQKWGLLSSQYALQPPTDRRLRQAWDLLDSKFPPGPKEVAIVAPLIELINPPHGYDYNTVTLLFAAWVGYHIQDLELRMSGKILTSAILSDFLQKGSRDFIQNCKTANVVLMRRNPNDVRLEVRAIIDRKESNPLTIEEAENALVKLKSFCNDTRNNSREREESEAKTVALQEALESAKQYREKAGKVQDQVDNNQNYRTMLAALDTLKQLPRLTLVKTNDAAVGVLYQGILTGLDRVINSECKTLENPEHSRQIGLNERQLLVIRDAIKRAGITQLDFRIQEALNTLKQAEQKLEKRQSEEGVRTEIDAIDLAGSLNYLKDTAKRLEQMEEYSPEILALRDQKLEYLTHTIAELEGQVQQIQLEIDAANSDHKADLLRDRLLKISARFQDSHYQAIIQTTLERLSALREFFQEIKQLQGQLIQTPNDVDTMLQKCTAIQTQYANVLTPAQIIVTNQLKQSICNQSTTKQTEAMAWLQSCADEFRRGMNISRVAEKLSSPPIFLPNNAMSELDRLRTGVQECIDNDALLQVEKAFRTIAERKRQEECLQRLTQIMDERPASSWAFWRKKE